MSSTQARWDKLLVLDLDDTLIHTHELNQPMLAWPPQRVIARYRVYLRPGAGEFMDWALERFAAVAIWTSANAAYAQTMLASFVGERDRLAFVWSREYCDPIKPTEGRYIWHKDLAELVALGWSQANLLVVDDKPECLVNADANLIAMPRFAGDPSDRMLDQLRVFLATLGPLADVRSIDKREWWTKLEPRVTD